MNLQSPRIVPSDFAANVPIVGQPRDESAPDSPLVVPATSAPTHPASPPQSLDPVGSPADDPRRNPLAREETMSFNRDEIDAAVNARLEKLRPTAQIPGFRKGRVSLEMMRRRFGQQHLAEELTRRAEARFNEEKRGHGDFVSNGERIVVGASSLQVAVQTPEHGDYIVRCGYEVYPDIPPPDFSRVRIGRPVANITPADADLMIERIRIERGGWHKVDRPAQMGDLATVDYQATENGVRVDGAKNRGWPLNRGGPLSDVTEALVGAAAGDVRVAELTHAADHPDPEWRGRKVRVRVAVKSVAELRIPVLNDAFFALFGVNQGGLDAFREKIREMTAREAEWRCDEMLRQRTLLALSMATPQFPLPTLLVRNEIAVIRQAALENAKRRGLPPTPASANELLAAAQRVRLGLAVDAWRRREDVKITAEDLEARLNEVAMERGGADPESFKEQAREDINIMSNLEMEILEDRAVEWTRAQAPVFDQPATMEELWGWAAPKGENENGGGDHSHHPQVQMETETGSGLEPQPSPQPSPQPPSSESEASPGMGSGAGLESEPRSGTESDSSPELQPRSGTESTESGTESTESGTVSESNPRSGTDSQSQSEGRTHG